MNDNQRKEEIKKILSQIEPLNSKRILLGTKLHFFCDKNNETEKLEEDISNIYSKLKPLMEKLNKLQCKYLIEFRGELTNVHTEKKYWNTNEKWTFYLETCCDIDTFSNNWVTYINNSCVNDLITEVHQVIFRQFYTNFEILNIKRI